MSIKLTIFLFIFLFTNNVIADNKQIKTNIKSEIIKIAKNKNFIEFKDNVILVREDISFLADKMIVFTKKNKNISNDFQIELIEADGKVKIFSQEFIATGDSGIYDIRKNFFKIYGNVILNEGTRIANGSEFVYDITTEKGSLLSKKKRPIIIINEDLNNLTKDIDENLND